MEQSQILLKERESKINELELKINILELIQIVKSCTKPKKHYKRDTYKLVKAEDDEEGKEGYRYSPETWITPYKLKIPSEKMGVFLNQIDSVKEFPIKNSHFYLNKVKQRFIWDIHKFYELTFEVKNRDNKNHLNFDARMNLGDKESGYLFLHGYFYKKSSEFKTEVIENVLPNQDVEKFFRGVSKILTFPQEIRVL